jgi:protein-tyrosine phosphatase
MDLVDIHNHVLPGIDDGPRDLDASLRLLRAAWDSGVRRIVATPHRFLPPWDNADASSVRASYDRLREELVRRAAEPGLGFLSQLRIDLGAEHHLTDELLTALDRGGLLTLNGSRYVLVELPSLMTLDIVLAAARRIQGRGLVPVIAHVERTSFFQDSSESRSLERLAASGCVLQVNAEALLGTRRRDPLRSRCLELIGERIVRIVASDAHGTRSRPPLLHAALDVLRRELGEDAAVASVSESPWSLLEDRPLV